MRNRKDVLRAVTIRLRRWIRADTEKITSRSAEWTGASEFWRQVKCKGLWLNFLQKVYRVSGQSPEKQKIHTEKSCRIVIYGRLFLCSYDRKTAEKREKRCAFSNIHAFVCLCTKNRRKSKLSADIFQKWPCKFYRFVLYYYIKITACGTVQMKRAAFLFE